MLKSSLCDYSDAHILVSGTITAAPKARDNPNNVNNYFNNYYKMIAIDLSKQQALDGNPKAIQQIKFSEYLNLGEDENDNTTMFFIIEEVKEAILHFSQGP